MEASSEFTQDGGALVFASGSGIQLKRCSAAKCVPVVLGTLSEQDHASADVSDRDALA